MEEVIAEAAFTYFHGFTKELFPDYRSAQSLDIIAAGFARAMARYEQTVERPFMRVLAMNLLESSAAD